MKKPLIYISMSVLFATLTTISFTSCNNDDDDLLPIAMPQQDIPTNPLAQEYCNIEGASYIKEALPKSNSNETLNVVQTSISDKVGSSTTITIESAKKLDKFYIGVEGVEGYYSVNAIETPTTRAGLHIYYVALKFSGTSANEFVLTINGVCEGSDSNTTITQTSKVIIKLEAAYASSGIVGKWGNFHLIYSPDPEDYEEPMAAGSYEEYYANGMGYCYDAEYEEDSFGFQYTYNPLTGELTKMCGLNGVIKMGCTITFSADGNTMYVNETYYYDPSEGWDYTYLRKYSVTRID